MTLAVETSSARYAVALGAGDGVAFNSILDLPGDTSRDLAELLARGLAACGGRAVDIEAIAVNIGPGSLGSLRDGVSFANGLAYALGRPVFPFTSFELIGRAAWRNTPVDTPVLCTRRANEGLAYAGVFDGARVARMRFGKLEEIVPLVAGPGRRFSAAGSFRAETARLLAHAEVADSGVETPDAVTMLQVGVRGRTPCDPLLSPAGPLNERSAIFHD